MEEGTLGERGCIGDAGDGVGRGRRRHSVVMAVGPGEPGPGHVALIPSQKAMWH